MRPRTVAMSLVAVVALGLGVLAGMLTAGPEGATKQAGQVPEVRSSTASPAPSQTEEPEPSPSPSVIANPAEPVRLIAASVSIEGDVYPHESSTEKPINPRDAWSIAWWTGGGQPGATPENTSRQPGELAYTTYLYGHSGDNPAVFNTVKDLGEGDEIVLETTDGIYRYRVEYLLTVPKPDLSQDARLIEDVPGRLVLISCWRGPSHVTGQTTTENVVAIAQFDSFVPATHG